MTGRYRAPATNRLALPPLVNLFGARVYTAAAVLVATPLAWHLFGGPW